MTRNLVVLNRIFTLTSIEIQFHFILNYFTYLLPIQFFFSTFYRIHPNKFPGLRQFFGDSIEEEYNMNSFLLDVSSLSSNPESIEKACKIYNDFIKDVFFITDFHKIPNELTKFFSQLFLCKGSNSSFGDTEKTNSGRSWGK